MQYKGKCYYRSTVNSAGFLEACGYCETLNATLYSPNNAEEKKYIGTKLFPNVWVWLGGRESLHQKRMFTWLNGNSLDGTLVKYYYCDPAFCCALSAPNVNDYYAYPCNSGGRKALCVKEGSVSGTTSV